MTYTMDKVAAAYGSAFEIIEMEKDSAFATNPQQKAEMIARATKRGPAKLTQTFGGLRQLGRQGAKTTPSRTAALLKQVGRGARVA